MNRDSKYISKVLNDFFSGRYDAEVEEDVQKWIVDNKFQEEKEAVLLHIWEKLYVKADESTYESLKTVQSKLGFKKKGRVAIHLRRRFLKVAAVVVFFLFLITGGYYLFRNQSGIIELNVPYGQLVEKTLSDGTNMWVNSGSAVTHKENIRADRERRLSLTGEAAFAVEKNKRKPFVIETKYLSVRVLGTELNVKAYSVESKTVVTLATGSVSIESVKGDTYHLKPNQQLIYDNETGHASIEEVDAEEFMGWRVGQLLFDDATFEELLAGIERHHGIIIDVDEGVSSRDDLYTIRFINRESVAQTMFILHELVGGFGYNIGEDNSVYIYNPDNNPATSREPESTALTSKVSVSDVKTADIINTVTIQSEKISYRSIFDEIELQTGFTIGYNQTKFDAYREIPVSQEGVSLDDILTHILKDTGFGYFIEGNHIIIVEKEEVLYTITGYIFDSESGLPIANAHIVPNNDTSLGARSSSTGHFSIEGLTSGNYSVKVNAEGYQPKFTDILLSGETGVSVRIDIEEAIRDIQPLTGSIFTEKEAVIVPAISKMDRPHLVLKSNLLYLSTTTPNVAVEFSLNNRWTLDMTVGYNPFTFSNNKKFQHLLLQSELRYWPRFAFNRHFIGMHLHYGTYDIAGVGSNSMIPMRYEGHLIGGGLSYGYNYKINQKWAVEGTIGFGYARMNYDMYLRDSDPYSSLTGKWPGSSYNYFGPTKVGINFIYTIK